MAKRLNDEALREALALLPLWQHDAPQGAITRRYRFADFSQAFGFMAQVALAAERLGHHPDWRNDHHIVDMRLRTHDAGGLTALDFELARCADAAHAQCAA